jgi:hypothetical protein
VHYIYKFKIFQKLGNFPKWALWTRHLYPYQFCTWCSRLGIFCHFSFITWLQENRFLVRHCSNINWNLKKEEKIEMGQALFRFLGETQWG